MRNIFLSNENSPPPKHLYLQLNFLRLTESSARAAYALVKKATSTFHTFSQSHQARLQSYEIFNPETEDIDTDSSGVSTPDSFGSVISVKMDSSNGTPLTGKLREQTFTSP